MKIEREKIFDVIKKVKDLNDVDTDKDYDLINDLGFGSFDFVALMGELWMEFNVRIDSHDFVKNNFRNTEQLVKLLNK